MLIIFYFKILISKKFIDTYPEKQKTQLQLLSANRLCQMSKYVL